MTETGDILRENIRELRTRSGKTKSELCNSIGMSRRFWDDVESGAKEPSVSTLERIASLFDVTVRDLLTEQRPSKGKRKELTGSRK